MSLDPKALRALYEAALADDENDTKGYAFTDALMVALPDLLMLAEAVRDLAPVLADLNETGAPSLSAADRDNLRALLAILDTPPRAAGDDR